MDSPGRDPGTKRSPAADAWPRLLTEKVTIPERVTGYFHRPGLVEQFMSSRRVVLLKAPAGFGKTTLLAEACRRLQGAGVLTAWLTLDVQDVPDALDGYLAFAFQEAGLNVLDALDAQSEREGSPEHRTELVARAVRQHGSPCLLALDELERLANPASLALISFLLQWGPPNLRIALAARELPAALDVASSVYEGHATVITANQLRFSESQVASFFGPDLPRREVEALARESSGWPIALRILWNERHGATIGDARDATDVAGNWVESRLWRGMAESDRELVLDLGLFERIDAELLDEVLDGTDLKRRVDALPALAGLLESVRGEASDTWTMHPLIREHCAKQRYLETPDRFRSIHQRIAAVLARRGETVAAMRHAAAGGHTDLAGEILLEAGGLRLWLREGLIRLEAADSLLTTHMMDKSPRLALAHSLVLLLTGRLGAARRFYDDTIATLNGSVEHALADDFELLLDDVTLRGLLCLYGGERFSSPKLQSAIADRTRLANDPQVDAATRCSFELGVSMAHNFKAEFDWAEKHLSRAERSLDDNPYITMTACHQRGLIAMAQGRVAVATDCYARAQRIARASFLRDPGPAALSDVLMRELDLERNRTAHLGLARRIPRVLLETGTPLGTYAAAAGVAVDITAQFDGIHEALRRAEEMHDYVRERQMPALVRFVAALRVMLLTLAGRIGDAEHGWRSDGLPETREGCLDLSGQSWREMEALCGARLSLHIAGGKFDAARRTAHALDALAVERGLRRTRMRNLAAWIKLECNAGEPAAAEDRLVRFLRLYAETDYARPLFRERTVCLPVLESWLERDPDASLKEEAIRLRDMFRQAVTEESAAPGFSFRELDVLQRLDSQQDKEIAKALSLTHAGVRYHVGNIFTKLGAHSRQEARFSRTRDRHATGNLTGAEPDRLPPPHLHRLSDPSCMHDSVRRLVSVSGLVLMSDVTRIGLE